MPFTRHLSLQEFERLNLCLYPAMPFCDSRPQHREAVTHSLLPLPNSCLRVLQTQYGVRFEIFFATSLHIRAGKALNDLSQCAEDLRLYWQPDGPGQEGKVDRFSGIYPCSTPNTQLIVKSGLRNAASHSEMGAGRLWSVCCASRDSRSCSNSASSTSSSSRSPASGCMLWVFLSLLA